MKNSADSRLRTSKLLWTTGVILLLIAVMLTACGKDNNSGNGSANDGKGKGTEATQSEVIDASLPERVAEFNGGAVTRDELIKFHKVTQFLNPDLQKQPVQPGYRNNQLYTYVFYKLAAAKVKKKTAKNDEFINNLLAQTETQMNKQFGEDGFNKRLKQFDLVKDDVLQYLLSYNDSVEYVNEQLTDADLQAEYNRRIQANELKKTIATVSHILISANEGQKDGRSQADALKRAQEVLAKLKGGGDFAALAKTYSDDPGSKNNGGTYADANVDGWVPEFKQAAIDLPLNTLSEPVKTQFGYHIMKVSKRSQTPKTFTEAKAEVEQSAWQKKYQEVSQREIDTNMRRNFLLE